MNQMMDEYEIEGQVVWTYWQFTNRFFELTQSNNQTVFDTILPQIAKEIGIKQEAFWSYLESGKYNQHIQNDIDNAM